MGLMNMFTKKKKWIRFYSVDPGVATLHPLYPARKLQRKWRTDALKDMNTSERRCPYLKLKNAWTRASNELRGIQGDVPANVAHAVTCPAIANIMDSGYILPCPGDIMIRTDGSGVNFEWMSQVLFGPAKRFVKAHAPEQTEGFRQLVDQQKDVLDWTIKLELPWRVQAHPDIVFIQMPIAYHDEDRFSPPLGIVDPSYSYEINLQLFWHKIEEGEYLIKAGTPLCQWVPVHRDFLRMKGWDVVIEEANADDFENNELMEYQKHRHFMEFQTLRDRIKTHKLILSLNKNIKRFM